MTSSKAGGRWPEAGFSVAGFCKIILFSSCKTFWLEILVEIFRGAVSATDETLSLTMNLSSPVEMHVNFDWLTLPGILFGKLTGLTSQTEFSPEIGNECLKVLIEAISLEIS
jgi:hypothetical protein